MLPLLSSVFSSADSVLWFVDTFMTLFCWKCLETNQNEGVLLKQKYASRLYIARGHGTLSIQQKFRFEISEISGAQWSCTFRLDRPDPSHRAFGYCSCKQDTKERHWTTILSNGKGHFGPTDRNDQTGQSGPSSKLVPNIPVGPNGNGPFHLVYQPKFPELWVEWKAPMNWGPVHKYPFLFENRFFFSDLVYRPHVSGENSHWKRIFQKRSPEWRFSKTTAFCLRVEGRRRRFSNTMTSGENDT